MKRLALIAIGLICLQNTAFATVPSIERNALVALYNSTSGVDWTENKNWLTDDPCLKEWYGVVCDQNENITQILLYSNNLEGAIPSELGNLTSLNYLLMYDNQLTGSIPAGLGNLANLEWMWLFNNQLNGPIPAQLGDLVKLEKLDLSNNQLNGSIPAAIGDLANLIWLQLDNNQLSESIPSELGNLTSLSYLLMYDNQLTGSIPAGLGNLANLEWMWLFNNQLSGPIPVQLGNLINLEQIDLAGNQLSGTVPATLMNLTTLKDGFGLNLSWNSLHTADADLDIFMDAKSGRDWSSTQTIAPENVTVTNVSETSASLSWSEIEYTSNGGGYSALYSTAPGGPYKEGGSTASKSITSLTINGLWLGVSYYFVVQSNTNSHTFNQNSLTSELSSEVHAKTLGENIIYKNGFEEH